MIHLTLPSSTLSLSLSATLLPHPRYARLLYGAFDYYASDDTSVMTTGGEPDIFNVEFNAYMRFSRDCELVEHSKVCECIPPVSDCTESAT